MPAGPVCVEAGSVCLKRMILETNAQVVPFYELYKAGGFRKGDPRGEAFALARVASGAAWLRDLTAQVWRDSGEAKVGWPEVPVADIESGKVDPWEALYGRD